MGILYIVATPIGNLTDITLRAIEILKDVNLIACEDTRHSRILLDKYDIKTQTISYFQHSKLQKINLIIDKLKNGQDIALITDAGTPGVSDPGSRLIKEAIKYNIKVEPIPGPAAFLTALSVSGFSLKEFLYLGFLPKKKGRQTLLNKLKNEQKVIVFYESPFRILKTLKDIQDYLGDKEVCVCRELTKKFEEIYRGKISEVDQKIKPKGEFVVIINNQG